MDRIEEILHYWFGHIESTIIPTPNRKHIWFSGAKDVDLEVREKFLPDLEKAVSGDYASWEETPRGSLALIIILQQFTRYIYRSTSLAYANDHKALDLCVRGIEKQFDHTLSLIERAFFYSPLMHAENLEMQSTSVRAHKILLDLSFPEARGIFEMLLAESLRRFDIIKRFSRFPHRNELLGRQSTEEELRSLLQEKPR